MIDDYCEWKKFEFENSNDFKLLRNKLIHLENTNKFSGIEEVINQISKLKSES